MCHYIGLSLKADAIHIILLIVAYIIKKGSEAKWANPQKIDVAPEFWI